MKRLAIIVVAVTAICVALVHVRRQEARVRYEIHRRLSRQTVLRRRLWDRRVRIAHLVAPREVRRRTREMALGLTGEDEGRSSLAGAHDLAPPRQAGRSER